MEIFDLVNEKDEVTGQATREEFHSNPKLIHRVVHFTLADKKRGQILITLRAFNLKTDPGKWCFLGEHIAAGENYKEALKRGADEELGLDISNFKEVNHRLIRSPKQTEFARFFIIDWVSEPINFDKAEVVKVRWLNPEELIKGKNNYSEQTRYWVENTDWQRLFSRSLF